MPTAPARPCRTPGCPALVQGGGYCVAHRAHAPNRIADQRRGSSSARGYDVHWQRIRAQFLRKFPLCGGNEATAIAHALEVTGTVYGIASECAAADRVTAAAVVDHVVALRDGGTNEHANLRALCTRCHNARTMRDQVAGARGGA